VLIASFNFAPASVFVMVAVLLEQKVKVQMISSINLSNSVIPLILSTFDQLILFMLYQFVFKFLVISVINFIIGPFIYC
jgi:hypothetical protein